MLPIPGLFVVTVFYPDPDPDQYRRGAWLTSAGTGRKPGGIGCHRPRGLDRPAVIAIISGHMRYETAEGSWRIGRDGLLWLLPDREHSYRPDDVCEEAWFILDGHNLRRLFAKRIRPGHPVSHRCSEDQRQAVRRAREALTERRPRANELATLAIEELLALHEVPPRDSGVVDPVATAALVRIEQSGGRISPAIVARDLGMPYAVLRRRFHAAYGSSMIETCTSIRLRLAKSLLAETDLDVAAIAEACGYRDPFFFARQFRRHSGCPPTAFRHACSLGR